ncbi:MAG TPA: polysaccharide deacetylase family protein [Clostridia bacterium]|nr:polysaccharide deacetylase family protein [Clostridia bacterium]
MLRVLTYHRIVDSNSLSIVTNVSAPPAAFREQVRYLAENYNVVSMDDVLNAAQTGVELPDRAVLLTFDDAYRDFGEVAWPILKTYGLPVTLFVPTAYPGDSSRVFWWDRIKASIMLTPKTETQVAGREFRFRSQLERYRAYITILHCIEDMPNEEAMQVVAQLSQSLGEFHARAPLVLSWPELRRLANEGVTLGAHTRTHPIMTRISAERTREEAAGSLKDLQREIGRVTPVFAYPAGRHDDHAVRILREEGFVLGFTTMDGHNDLASADPLRLRRTNITPRTSMPIFRLRLLPAFAHLDALRHRYAPRFFAA